MAPGIYQNGKEGHWTELCLPTEKQYKFVFLILLRVYRNWKPEGTHPLKHSKASLSMSTFQGYIGM